MRLLVPCAMMLATGMSFSIPFGLSLQGSTTGLVLAAPSMDVPGFLGFLFGGAGISVKGPAQARRWQVLKPPVSFFQGPHTRLALAAPQSDAPGFVGCMFVCLFM